jgi:hypothetical protein
VQLCMTTIGSSRALVVRAHAPRLSHLAASLALRPALVPLFALIAGHANAVTGRPFVSCGTAISCSSHTHTHTHTHMRSWRCAHQEFETRPLTQQLRALVNQY